MMPEPSSMEPTVNLEVGMMLKGDKAQDKTMEVAVDTVGMTSFMSSIGPLGKTRRK